MLDAMMCARNLTTQRLKLLSRLHGVTSSGNRSKQAKRDCQSGLVAEKRKRKNKRRAEEGKGGMEGRVTVWKEGKRREQRSMFPPQNKVGCRNCASRLSFPLSNLKGNAEADTPG